MDVRVHEGLPRRDAVEADVIGVLALAAAASLVRNRRRRSLGAGG